MSNPDQSGVSQNPCRSVVLIGFMGSGKTVVGKELSRKLECRLFDTDKELELQFGKPIPAIFRDLGEPAFRRAETDWLRQFVSETPSEVLASPDGRLILSTGGGTPLSSDNAALLRQIGAVVYLHAASGTVYERVRAHLDQRPLLAGHAHDPLSRIEQLLAERLPKYQAVADIQVESTLSRRPADVAEEIVERLGLHTEPCRKQ